MSQNYCYVCEPSQIHMLKLKPLEPQNVTVFRNRAFEEVIKVK